MRAGEHMGRNLKKIAIAFALGLGVECILAVASGDLLATTSQNVILGLMLLLALFISNNFIESRKLSVKWLTVGAILGALLSAHVEKSECSNKRVQDLAVHSAPAAADSRRGKQSH